MFTVLHIALVYLSIGPISSDLWRNLKLTSSKSILEDLLETQELENGQIDRWVKSETTLVWTKSRVELDTETPIASISRRPSLVIND